MRSKFMPSADSLHDRERHVEHRLERVDRDRLVGLMVALGAVGQVEHRQSAGDQGVGVAAAAGVDVDGLDPARLERSRGGLDQGRAALELVAAEQALDGGLNVALGVARRLGGGVDDRAHDLAGAGVVETARLEHHPAALGHDVGGRAALDLPDVGGGGVVEAPEIHRCHGARRRRNRVATRLRANARVRRVAAESRLDAVVGGRCEDDFPDRRRVVENEAELRLKPAAVERLGARERHLLAGGEQQLDAHGRALGREPASAAEDGRHRGLVVGAEDRVVAVAEDAVLARDLHRAGERDRIQVGAEQDRAGVLGPADPGEEVARLGAGFGAGVVLLDLQPERAELRADGLGDRPLALGGALDLAEPNEVIEQPLALGFR